MAIFTGAGVAIVTPFYEDGKVNYNKLTELLEEQIAGKTDSIIICGTTGESSTLTEEEHSKVICHAVKVVAGRIPVVAGTGSNSTKTAIQLSKDAEADGADGLLVVTPYYNKATQKGLVEHYRAIANEVSLPIIVYNVPSRTGLNVKPQTMVEMARSIKNVVGIKEASSDIVQIGTLAALADGDVDIYSGNDDQIVPVLSVGGIGVISVTSNIIPEDTHNMVAQYLAGNVLESMRLQLKVMPLALALFSEVNPIPVKVAMNLMGKNVGPVRSPLSAMEPENIERLKKTMIEYGLSLA